MKPTPQLKKILAWVLTGQSEAKPVVEGARTLPDRRMQESLEGSNAFSDEERNLLLRSPKARARLRFLYEVRRAEQLMRWRELLVDQALSLKAAAGGPVEPVTLENEDFRLSFLPLDPKGHEWTMHLKVAQRLLTDLRGAPIRVRDEDGAVLLTGLPDTDGELSGLWPLKDSPLLSLTKTRLIVEPT